MSEKLRILLLEDLPTDVDLVRRELQKANFEFEFETADSREGFVAALDHFSPQVILSDHSLPQFNSREAFAIVKERKMEVPFILVTGTVSEEFAVESLKAGVDDYILKTSLKRLPASIENAIQKRNIEKERKQAFEQLKEINQELSAFVYRASHDLKGPLSSIIGLTELARVSPSDQLPKFIEMIGESTQRLDVILLSLIHAMQAGEHEAKAEPINFRQLISDILTRLEHVEGYNLMSFNVDIQANNAIESDSILLNSILQNIIENAIKYRNERTVQPEISILIEDADDGVLIRISDNGIGISQAVLSKVFNMFFRGNESSKGSGLGLYIVKKAVDKLKGHITLESTEGTGTTFSIFIPDLPTRRRKAFSSGF